MAISKKNKRLPVTLPLSMFDQIQKKAEAEGRSMSNFIRRILRDRL